MKPVDRWTLDAVQFSSKGCLRLVTDKMSDICLRSIENATFDAPTEKNDNRLLIQVSGRPERRETSNARPAHAEFSSAFLLTLRSSRVATLTIGGLAFTSALATLVLETSVFAHKLTFRECSFAELTPAQFHGLIVHFSPTSLDLGRLNHLRAGHITDEFLHVMSKNHVRCIHFPDDDVLSFGVTDDAIVDFCVHSDEPIRQVVGPLSMRDAYGELYMHNIRFTKELFKRLVEASTVSMRAQSLKISVSLARVDEDDLRDFAQHLSYRDRDARWYLLIYDFPGKARGEAAAFDFQIAFRPSASWLQIVRAQRPSPLFYKAGNEWD